MRTSLLTLLTAAAACCPSTSGALHAQSDDFSSGNDKGWTRYSPLSPFVAGATYSFPLGGYRITAPASPAPEIVGPQRAGSLRTGQTVSRVQVEAEVGNWDNSINQAFGVLVRVGSVGLGTTAGYSYNYNTKSGFHQLTLIQGETPARQVNESPYRLDPNAHYRLVFTAVDSLLIGQVFSTTNSVVPIHSVIGRDETFESGLAGVFAFSLDPATGVNAWFDNYKPSVPAKVRALFLDAAPAVGEIPDAPVASVTVRLAHGESKIQTSSLALEIDGKAAPFTVDSNDTTLFLTSTPAAALDQSQPHKAKVTFTDETGPQTVEWNFGAPLPASATGPKLLGASTPKGDYIVESAATLDAGGIVFTLPRPSTTRFYKVSDSIARTIASSELTATELRIRLRP